jgi:hypothetical protein
MPQPNQPSRTARLLVALGVATVAAVIAWVKIQQNGLLYDFAYFWVAGRALLTGGDPYTAVQPGAVQFGEVRFDNWFMYPLPAALGGAAVAWLPMQAASVVFVAAAFGLLAFALTADGWWRLPILMSAPALWCMTTGQWAPLTLAAAMTPAFAWAAVAKPTLGFAAFAYRPSWRFVWVGVATIGLALLVRPNWPMQWWDAARKTASINYAIPVQQPFGWLLALGVLRWKTAEGRLLLAMACAPQSMLMYDQFPLLLVARTRLEAIAFSLWSYLVPWAMVFVTTPPAADTKAETLPYMGRVLTLTMYLPALAVVLTRRRST